MAKTAESKLTSEERCELQFRRWWDSVDTDLTNRDLLTRQDFAAAAWKAAWRHLERNAREFLKT